MTFRNRKRGISTRRYVRERANGARGPHQGIVLKFGSFSSNRKVVAFRRSLCDGIFFRRLRRTTMHPPLHQPEPAGRIAMALYFAACYGSMIYRAEAFELDMHNQIAVRAIGAGSAPFGRFVSSCLLGTAVLATKKIPSHKDRRKATKEHHKDNTRTPNRRTRRATARQRSPPSNAAPRAARVACGGGGGRHACPCCS